MSRIVKAADAPPPRRFTGGRPVLGMHVDFSALEVGDMWEAGLDEFEDGRDMARVRSQAHSFGYRSGRKFITRVAEGRFRVWRVQ